MGVQGCSFNLTIAPFLQEHFFICQAEFLLSFLWYSVDHISGCVHLFFYATTYKLQNTQKGKRALKASGLGVDAVKTLLILTTMLCALFT